MRQRTESCPTSQDCSPGPRSRRLLLAGDFTILHGYGEDGTRYWGKRYGSVFDRAEVGTGRRLPTGTRAGCLPTPMTHSRASAAPEFAG